MSRPAVVIYGALSKRKSKRDADDRRDEESTESQVAKVHARLAQLYGDEVDVLGVFQEAGHSGSRKNRGPELERAIAAVTQAADEGRQVVELWANTSARFARGTGKRDEARAVGELFYDLRRRGVALRTVEDDEFVTNEMLVGFASAQAAKYARDLSESVVRAKRRQAERGEHLGGPMPLGYRLADTKQPVLDPAHAPTVERILELAAQGVPDSALARTVNREGHRTRGGRPFDRRAIQAIVTNPFYAGLVVYGGEEFEASHPRLIEREAWRSLMAAREKRDRGTDRHKAGAPARRHLLATLAVCGRCGERLYAVTSSYRRKDGTRARQYVCHAYKFATGTCDAKPIDAETVDTAVMERLHDLLPDFESWIAQIEDRHAAERQRLQERVQSAEHDRNGRQEAVAKHERQHRRYVEADDEQKADLALEFVMQARRDLADAETRLQATRDALTSVPVDAPRDRLLDFAINLREAIRGKVADATSIEDVNRALVESFEAFVIWDDSLPLELPADADASKPSLPDDEGVHAGRIKIDPQLRMEVARALLDSGHDEAEIRPPLEWIEAVDKTGRTGTGNPDLSHE